MITRIAGSGLYEVDCDHCSNGYREVPFTEAGSWDRLIALLKGAGWMIARRIEGGIEQWKHSCPDCAGAAKRQAKSGRLV